MLHVSEGLLSIDAQNWYLSEDGDDKNQMNATLIHPNKFEISASLMGPQKIVVEMPLSLTSTSYKLKVCGGIKAGDLEDITANVFLMQTN